MLFTKRQNPDATVINLLRVLSIKIDSQTITTQLEKHPHYPSLLAISDVLLSFGIKNTAYQIDFDILSTVSGPFIAHTSINGGDFLVIKKIDGGNLVVCGEKWNRRKISFEEFKKVFIGVVLTTQSSKTAFVKSTFTTIIPALKVPAIIIGFILLLLLTLKSANFFATINWQVVVLFILKMVGLATSILLLIQSIDTSNPLVQILCQNTGKTNCSAVLSSKAAKIFEWLTWSEVGFFYFAGTWLLTIFGAGSHFMFWTLAILNLISLPYTVYSIYYQAHIAKQWCVLCCTVQALLWVEFAVLLKTFLKPIRHMESGDFEMVCICLLVPILIWISLKPVFLNQQQLASLKQQLRKFKFNSELFNKILIDQPKYVQPDGDWSIALGNVEANSVVTMISNPYCPPCAKMHENLETLLKKNGNIQARLVFTAGNNDDDKRTVVSRHLMALNELSDKNIIKNALSDWYQQKQKDYVAWAKMYPVHLDETNFDKLKKQYNWCQMAEITATPTILLNGYLLPEIYQVTDLEYMLE